MWTTLHTPTLSTVAAQGTYLSMTHVHNTPAHTHQPQAPRAHLGDVGLHGQLRAGQGLGGCPDVRTVGPRRTVTEWGTTTVQRPWGIRELLHKYNIFVMAVHLFLTF